MNRLKIRRNRRLGVAALVAVAVAVTVAPAAVAKPTPGKAQETYLPGVTDSTTGVLAELERRAASGKLPMHDRYGEFQPGVTDSTTGVLRELERRGSAPREIVPISQPADGFQWVDAALGMAATFGLATIALGSGVLVQRRRRLAI